MVEEEEDVMGEDDLVDAMGGMEVPADGDEDELDGLGIADRGLQVGKILRIEA